MSRGGRIKCTFACSSPDLEDFNQAASHLFRIAQEAVNNAVKHSCAGEVVVRLANNNGALHLEISDNGRGLPKAPQLNQGIGLQIMKYRASVIGGELEVKSKAGKGVTVTCTLKTNQ